MKPLFEMSHYEVLEIAADASPEQVERAYRMAQATWGEGALAAYSLYGEEELAAMRERVELAYRVLSDAEAREAYDGSVAPDDEALPDELEIDLQFVDAVEESPAVDRVAAEIESFEDAADESGAWDGARLRRARLRRGIALEKIAEVTKINPTYLRSIEEDQYGDLPARVYVRGFVVSYARCLGLDPERVAGSYLECLREAEPPPRRTRRGRRG